MFNGLKIPSHHDRNNTFKFKQMYNELCQHKDKSIGASRDNIMVKT